jgi:hypothetical protein
MSFARAGKAAANEAKYPFIVEVPVAANGLNGELNSQIVGFHQSHHTPPRFGRTISRRANLLPLVLFRFGDGARLCRTVWRSILQNYRHLTCAASYDEGAADRGDSV